MSIGVKRANADASHRCMDINHRRSHPCAMQNLHIHNGIYRLLILNRNFKFTRFPLVKNECRVNAFYYVFADLPALTVTEDYPSGASPQPPAVCVTVCNRKINNCLRLLCLFKQNNFTTFYRLQSIPPMPRLGEDGAIILWACIMQR